MATVEEKLKQLQEKYDLDESEVEDLRASIDDASPLRKQIKDLSKRAAEADQLESELNKFKTLPKLKEALSRVGIDYDAQPLYAKKALDEIPADKLDDLEHVASYVSEQGFQATPKQEGEQQRPAAAQIVDQGLQGGSQVTTSEQDFHRDLDAVPDGDPQALREVLAKHGRLASDQGAVQNV